MRSLRSALRDEPLTKLLAIGDAWDAPMQATSPDAVVESLSRHMLVAEHAAAVVEGLPGHAGEALRALVKAGGKLPIAAFERRFGVIRAMGPGRLERERPWQAPVSAAEVLWYRGLLFRAFDRAGGAPVEAVFVPTDLLPLLMPDIGQAQPELRGAAPEPDRDAADAPSALLDDVVTLLCHAQNHEVRVRADGVWDVQARQIVARMLRDANGVLDAHPDGRFTFLLRLLNRLGWLRHQDGRLKLAPQPVASWLQQPANARREPLFNAWLNDPEWNDLAHVPGLELDMQHAWGNDPLRERAALLAMLDAWPAGVKHASTTAAFVAHVKHTNPDFARPDGRYDTWHIKDAHTGEFLNGFESWDRIEGALIESIIAGPLRWLEDPRVTQPVYTAGERPARRFAAGADGAITIDSTLAFERFQLARIADWQETQPGAFVYALTPRSLKRAADQGIKPARVLAFIEERQGGAVPDVLRRAIERWAERGPEARIEAVMLLRTRDSAAMDALQRIDAVRRATLERIAPAGAIIRARDARHVRAAIAQSGVLADLSD